MDEAKKTKNNIKKGKIKDKNLVSFLNEHVVKKTKVLVIIGLVLLGVIVSMYVFSDAKLFDEPFSVQKTSILANLKEKVIFILLVLLAGWVPYFYIPAIAYVIYIMMISGDLIINMELHGVGLTIIKNILPVFVDIFTVAIIAAIGIYMANYTTKKYRYAQRTSFTFLDVKINLYQITKKQDKYEEALAKKEEKIAAMEKNDVKIDYMSIIKVVPVILGINILTTIIQHVIN